MGEILQKDIAEALGLSRTTVSLALRGHPRIPARTRELIEATARDMGYQRNPMLAELATYRHGLRPSAFHGAFAWMVSSSDGEIWDQIPEFRDYYRGATDRAKELGYKLETIDLNQYRDSSRELARVMRSRGIRGCLVCPMPRPHARIVVSFENVSSVFFGYSVESPQSHRVAAHLYRGVMAIMDELLDRGYRRIGLLIDRYWSERVAMSFVSAYLAKQLQLPLSDRIPPLEFETKTAFAEWERQYQPDVVITARGYLKYWPKAVLEKIPDRLGVVDVSVNPESREFAGLNQCSYEIGRLGAQFLTFLVERGESGLPSLRQHMLVEPIWHEGDSILPKIGHNPEAAGLRG